MTVEQKDRSILRELASQVAEIADGLVGYIHGRVHFSSMIARLMML